jgi:hypothetical protein
MVMAQLFSLLSTNVCVYILLTVPWLEDSNVGFLFLAVLLTAAHGLNALVFTQAGRARPPQWHPEYR